MLMCCCVETLYWFGDNNHQEWSELFDAYIQPVLSLPGLTPAYSYGVAGQSILQVVIVLRC